VEWWIETDRFRDAAEKETAVNPGRYGEGLALWISEQLQGRAWQVVDQYAEDWGWEVRLRRQECDVYVRCGNEDGSTSRWALFGEARTGLLKRLMGNAGTAGQLAALDRDVEAILKDDAGISWFGREQPE
jgi:hypothetical protein